MAKTTGFDARLKYPKLTRNRCSQTVKDEAGKFAPKQQKLFIGFKGFNFLPNFFEVIKLNKII